MESILKGLNYEQKQAVLHEHSHDGALLVLAGAGSGKTSVLTRRIQYRIGQGVAPDQILALTFTAKAAAEMAERVQALFPGAGVKLCTFHSLGLFILKAVVAGVPNWQRLGFQQKPMPTESSLAGWMDTLVQNGLKPHSLDRENLFSPELRLPGPPERLQKLKQPIFASGKVVFEDLIWLSITLIQTFPEVRAWVRSTWRELMVDEYQDINPSQYNLVRAVLDGRSDLFVVGDDDQAIYGFRGADIGNIFRFQQDFPGCRVIRLEWNYRSTPSVLEVANRIFENKPATLRKTLRAGALRPYGLFRENRRPERWYSQTPLEEIERVVHAIKVWRLDYDLSWSDFAILVRYNRQRYYYIEVLGQWGLPVRQESVEDGIQVETIHASKGLQYPVVFYAGMARDLSPGELRGNRKQQRNQLAEEKRLFYVGVTRAEAHLVFLFCRRRYWRGALRVFKPSPFLQYCAPPSFGQGTYMPVCVFKAWTVLRILAYLASRMPSYVFTRLRRASEIPAWLEWNAQKWADFCIRTMRMDLRIEGQEKLAQVDWSRPVIVVANHESYADIPVVILTTGRILGFLAKYELGRIPFLAYWMRQIGCIFIKRGQKGVGAEISQQLAQSQGQVRVVIFPEGTRSRNGQVGVFKSGAFRMACDLNATILPIVHQGTREGWEDRRSSRWVQTVRSKILDPIDVKSLGQEKEISPKGDLLYPLHQQMSQVRQEL